MGSALSTSGVIPVVARSAPNRARRGRCWRCLSAIIGSGTVKRGDGRMGEDGNRIFAHRIIWIDARKIAIFIKAALRPL
jgi:hypothetical protein